MISPVTTDLEKCVIYDKVESWFNHPHVRKTLTSVNPLLLFNADETQITLSKRALKKVLWRKNGKKSDVVVPAGDRLQNNISLFVAVDRTYGGISNIGRRSNTVG